MAYRVAATLPSCLIPYLQRMINANTGLASLARISQWRDYNSYDKFIVHVKREGQKGGSGRLAFIAMDGLSTSGSANNSSGVTSIDRVWKNAPEKSGLDM